MPGAGHTEDAVATFVAAATSGRRARARRLLDAEPQIAADPWARLALGQGSFDGDPTQPGGPLGWQPLLYVAHSCFASVPLARELLARELLARGATRTRRSRTSTGRCPRCTAPPASSTTPR